MGKTKERLKSHNSDLSAILDGINNLPPAGSEDLQATAEAQTEVVNELLSLVKRKIAEKSGVIVTIDGELYNEDVQFLVFNDIMLGLSDLPYDFYNGSAVVLNNEIHILGSGDSGNYTKHYKWDGSTWTSVSTLPYNFSSGSAVVLDNEIHILGSGSGYTNHYKWNGTSWTSVSTLPYSFVYGSAVVLDNEIHILGGSVEKRKHLVCGTVYRKVA